VKRIATTAAVLAALAAAPAHAQDLHARTAGELAELCAAQPKDAPGTAKLNFCHGYAQAAVDAALRRAGDKKPFCLPSPAPTRQATLTEFAKWVQALPDNKGQNSQDALMRFMGQRFPCKA
jgi:hypothetical protein